MGTSDLIPGVSGGTMALILGVYEELITALRAFGRESFWRALSRGRWRTAFAAIHGDLLLPLSLGIATAILAFSRILGWLLERHHLKVYGFFFGLILASVFTVGRKVRSWQSITAISFILSAALAYLVVGLSPTETPESGWFLMLSGALAVCAFILPGISGAFVLVLLGKYSVILGAVNSAEVGTLILFGLGAAVGLISFAQVLSWLFRKHHDLILALLCGFMAGSLRKIWPWQEGNGVTFLPALPKFVNASGLETASLLAFLLAVLGFALVFLIEKQAAKKPIA